MSNEINLTFKVNKAEFDAIMQSTVAGTRLAAQAEKEYQEFLKHRADALKQGATGAPPPPAPGAPPNPIGSPGSAPLPPSFTSMSLPDRSKWVQDMAGQRADLIKTLQADRKAATENVRAIDDVLKGQGVKPPPAQPNGPTAKPKAKEEPSVFGGLEASFDHVTAGIERVTRVARATTERLNTASERLMNPYATRGEQARAVTSGIPIVGEVTDAYLALNEAAALAFVKDNSERARASMLALKESPARTEFAIQEQQSRSTFAQRSQYLNERRDLVRDSYDNEFPRLPRGIDRSTATGGVAYREEMGLIPARRQVQVAELQSRELKQKYDSLQMARNEEEGRLAELTIKYETDYGNAQKFRSSQATAKVPFDKAREIDSQRIVLETQTKMNASQAKLREITDQQKEVKEKMPETSNAVRQSMINFRGAELDRTREREDYASERAKGLGLMGVDGRMQSQLAFQVVQQMGVQNAPAELIAQARGYAPRTIDKQAEQAGEGFAEQGQKVAPADYTGKLSDIRKQVDAQQKAVEDAMIEGAKVMAQETVNYLEPIKKLIETFKMQMDNELQKLKTENLMKGRQQ